MAAFCGSYAGLIPVASHPFLFSPLRRAAFAGGCWVRLGSVLEPRCAKNLIYSCGDGYCVEDTYSKYHCRDGIHIYLAMATVVCWLGSRWLKAFLFPPSYKKKSKPSPSVSSPKKCGRRRPAIRLVRIPATQWKLFPHEPHISHMAKTEAIWRVPLFCPYPQKVIFLGSKLLFELCMYTACWISLKLMSEIRENAWWWRCCYIVHVLYSTFPLVGGIQRRYCTIRMYLPIPQTVREAPRIHFVLPHVYTYLRLQRRKMLDYHWLLPEDDGIFPG